MIVRIIHGTINRTQRYLQFGVVATSPTSLLEPPLFEDPEDWSGIGSPVLTKNKQDL